MSDFEARLRETVRDYERKHQCFPKSISMSYDFMPQLYNSTNCQLIINSNGRDSGADWSGFRIKFVRRKNYIEAMPRHKPIRRIPSSKKVWRKEHLGIWTFPDGMVLPSLKLTNA